MKLHSSRRGFLETALGGLTAGLGLVLAAICGAFLYPPRRSGETSRMFIGSTGQPITSDSISEGESQTGRLSGRTVIIVREKGDLTAFSAECTHAGCLVNWNPADKHFDCPCHGARYDLQGKVLRPPAPRPLTRLEIEVGADGYIHAKGAANAGKMA